VLVEVLTSINKIITLNEGNKASVFINLKFYLKKKYYYFEKY